MLTSTAMPSLRVTAFAPSTKGHGAFRGGGLGLPRATRIGRHLELITPENDRCDAVQPPTVASLIGSCRPFWPHLRLMRAVLDDAMTIVLSRRIRDSATLRSETIYWVLADDPEWVFSFLNVCDALTLDPNRLRARLAPWLTIGPRRRA
jgi:hypothetical protein